MRRDFKRRKKKRKFLRNRKKRLKRKYKNEYERRKMKQMSIKNSMRKELSFTLIRSKKRNKIIKGNEAKIRRLFRKT